MSSKTGRNIPKESLVKVQLASQSRNYASKSFRITIPDLGVEYYKRIIHDDGRIELIPMEIMETTVGIKGSDNGE